MSEARVLGLHHMTAICGPAQENLDFYVGVLGMRLIKKTVNFDDPGAYHLYYADSVGTPGTVLTFFPYPEGYPGRPGAGQATLTTLAIPGASLRYWIDRLKSHAVDVESARSRNIDFSAPDGLRLRMVAYAGYTPSKVWHDSPVPEEHQIGPIRSVTLEEEALEPTTELLTGIMGMHEVEPGVFGWSDPAAGRLEVLHRPNGPRSRSGRGSVHHIAFRVADESHQVELRSQLMADGYNVSPIMNRDYFRSIYFREPGGVLFEIATDGPGFTIDEPLSELGSGLRLPAMYESHRAAIEKALPPVRMPVP